MRIGFDTYNLGVTAGSGNKTYTVELINALCDLKTGDEWRLITYWRKKNACAAIFGERPRRVIQSRFPHPRLLGDHLRWPVKTLTSLLEKKLAGECDLFHCTNPINFPFSMPRVVTTIHDLIALRTEPWTSSNCKAYYEKRLDAIINRSRVLFSNSVFTRREIIDRYPSSADKILVTPLAARPMFSPVNKDRSFLKRFGIPDCERPYLLTVGEIQPRKNISGMFKAFESLGDRFRELHFIIIGQARNKSLSGGIFKEINASPKRGRIHVLHDVSDDDLVLFYNHAQGFVFYSFFEGFGLPVLEAMQCGCPVAVADNSSLTEIAEGAAIMVDPGNPESMREGMVRLVESESLRNDLQKKGFERAERFSWKHTAEITYRGYKQALGIN